MYYSSNKSPVAGILALCRIGFERDCILELERWLGERGANGYAKFEKLSGQVVWLGQSPVWPKTSELIFARQVVRLIDKQPLYFDAKDRITPILAALDGQQYSAIYLDNPDTNDGNSMADLFHRLQKPLLSAAGKANILNRDAKQRVHLVFIDGTSAWLGISEAGQTLKWPMGIPRLKMPQDAPSRSTLKLAEAFAYFMDREEQGEWLREGLTAVDLGACPGGWTYQLVKHGLQVIAIDNGAMNERIMETGQVEHIKADGFVYRPERPVHWLVCDMVEKPSRVAQLMADWLADGDAQRAMFNLKLPMKTRLDEVEYCREIIEETLKQAGKKIERLEFRQLYHDREEVTGFLVVN
ncbi:23S rRNA (cytidine(2498)-2'-O)-methyltransferase RlmM [Alkanindiges sp. WGS2144]|uniref:23S rRNA (cytidine(2498)-2'-O)-methyltransferase RlmM n=1 Tax=Alkanindiges sp. WGS2144 TaxID=3366808 RepID=UPI0037528F15